MTTPDAALAAALAERYAIDSELGRGGMATVWLARDLRHERAVAIKVLRPELSAALGPERFLREIHIAAQLQHPHILPLYDSGEAAGLLWYAMPYVEGESLRERLARQGELPITEAVRLVAEIVDALSYAHAHGVVHRDIKPDNVMLSGRHALVMDFGVAKAVSEATGRQTITTAGVALGTPTYMAPEQAVADPHLDHRVDIYAVGVMAYELLAGRPPFTGATPQQVLAAHVTATPEPLARQRPGIAPALDQVVMRCLAKRPADRWQSADELRAALEPLATPTGGVTPTATRPVRVVAQRSAVPRWLAWATGGALVAGGALALTLARRPGPALVVGRRIAVAVSAGIERWPALSPDGRTIVYSRADSGVSHLYVEQVDGGTPLAIPTGLAEWQCCGALSPDGSRMLFLTPRGLAVAPTLGGQSRLVAAGRPWRQPFVISQTGVLWGAWAPNGRDIAFTRRGEVLRQRVDEPGPGVVVARGGAVHSPAWSSDGRWLAYVTGNPQFHINGNLAPSAIMVVRAGGGTPVRVTDTLSLNTSPVWVPGRSALLFVSDRDGGRDVYELRLSGSGDAAGPPERITTGLEPDRIALSADGRRLAWSVLTESARIWSIPVPARDSAPASRAQAITTERQGIEALAESPDGAWLYYDSDLKGNSDIWRLPLARGTGLASGPAQQITTDPAPEFAASVSPDGREVAFHSFRTGNRDIFVAPAAGGPAVQVTTSPEHDWNARWSPDGRALAFDEELSDTGLWVVRRGADGRWGTPQPLLGRAFAGGFPQWSPDGRAISFATDSGLSVVELASGRVRRLIGPETVGWVAWSADSRTIYYTSADSLGRFAIKAVPMAGGRPRTLVWSDDPGRQIHRYGLALANGRFYFPLIDRAADVWVAEVARE